MFEVVYDPSLLGYIYLKNDKRGRLNRLSKKDNQFWI